MNTNMWMQINNKIRNIKALSALSIRTKIIVAFGAMLLTLIFLVASSFYLLSQQKADGIVINLAGRQRMLSQKMVKEALQLLTTQDLAEAQKKLSTTANLFDKTLKGLIDGDAALKLPPTEKGPIRDQLLKVKKMWIPFQKSINTICSASSIEELDVKDAMHVLIDNNIALLKEMNKAVGMMSSLSAKKVQQLQWLMLAGLAFGLCLFVVIIWAVNRYIIYPLQLVVGDVLQLKNGDLRPFQHVPHSDDEVGKVGRALEELRETFNEIIGMIGKKSVELADGSNSQAAAIEENSSAMEEISSMAKATADHAKEADGLMENSQKIIESATGSMKALRQAMEQVNTTSDETSNIIQSIDEIAFQTNLLALNAAVEAARAGEAGKGFAVVAEEVRNLAQRSAEAAKSTQELIETNRQNIKQSVEMVAETDKKLDKVQEISITAASLINQISSASQEQVLGIEQVNKAIAEIDIVAQNNANASQEMAESMKKFKTV